MEPQADPVRFRAVIDKTLLEPGMLQGLFGCNALLGVVDEDALKEVQEVAVERGIGGNEFLHAHKSVKFQSQCRWLASLTVNAFIARTYFREARVVSAFG